MVIAKIGQKNLKRVPSPRHRATLIGRLIPLDFELNGPVEGLDYSAHLWRLVSDERWVANPNPNEAVQIQQA